jgi:hypothetical protein
MVFDMLADEIMFTSVLFVVKLLDAFFFFLFFPV